MMRALKDLAHVLLPERVVASIQAYRSRNYQIRYITECGIPADNARFVQAYGTRILSGPFRGMEFPVAELGIRPAVPYILGTVERELHRILEIAVKRSY